MQTISAADFTQKMNNREDMVILDVRTDVEWNTEHLKGTIVHMPLHTLTDQSAARLKKIAGTQPIYILCRSGGRAGQALQFLAGHGLTNLHVIEGGIGECKNCGAQTKCRSLMSLERQVRIGAGVLVLLGLALGAYVSAWGYLLTGAVGAGLIFAGVTDRCGMALILAHAPWNRDPTAEARRSITCFSANKEQ